MRITLFGFFQLIVFKSLVTWYECWSCFRSLYEQGSRLLHPYQIESCQWVMYDESSQFILSWWHANLNWFEVLSFSWKFRFFWSLFGLFEGLFLLCWWFRPLIGPLTHPIDARLLPGKVEKHRKGWITIEKEWIAERSPAVNCKKSHVVVR